MSGQLNNLGLVKYMSDSVAQTLANARLSWQASFGLLQVSVSVCDQVLFLICPLLPSFIKQYLTSFGLLCSA